MSLHSIGATPAPDFGDPLGLLRACHQRMLQRCETLEKLPDYIAQHGVDSEVRTACRDVYQYFAGPGVLHHQDEEQDLFPLLVRESLRIAEIIHGLKQEHQRMSAAWQALAPLLARPEQLENPETLRECVSQFCALYRAHIQREERDFFSLAGHILSREQIKKLGKNMQKRREQIANRD